MTFAIAAAGTGGHVYPGLAVGEALVSAGVDKADILFVGGDRLEAAVYPKAGFPFLQVELRGLKRSFSSANLGIPRVVLRAIGVMKREFCVRNVGAVLGLGGYVTIPAALAARRCRIPLALAEQNAYAGLANRLAGRLADRRFASFQHTGGWEDYQWTGNPIRAALAQFDGAALRSEALARYGLDPAIPVVGVFGGSLGAGAINDGLARMVGTWTGPGVQILHLAGSIHAELMTTEAGRHQMPWIVVGFEDRMDLFYAACDVVVARAGGAVAELLATRKPSVLVPGEFGSGGHQAANAAVLEGAGAAIVVPQEEIADLGETISALISNPGKIAAMATRAASLARPFAAETVAVALVELHG